MTNEPFDEGSVISLTKRALTADSIRQSKCFLCGADPTLGKGEHIFPTWLQARFQLWDQTMHLLNGTTIPYRNLRVPACLDCNTKTLSRTERFVSELKGDDILKLDDGAKFEIARWMSKIFVSLLMKEATLLVDRRLPDAGTIFPASELDDIILLHLFIQSWRKLAVFRCIHGTHPFSLYSYKLERDARYSEFNFSTNLFGKSIAIRFGDVGLCFVGDGGLQHEIGPLGTFDLSGRTLHAAQFDEIAARVHYKAQLRDATHFYVHTEAPKDFVSMQLHVKHYSGERFAGGSRRIFRDWSDAELAIAFARYGVPDYEGLLDEEGRAVYTRLINDKGELINIAR